ncbi:hypothetical protein [Bailinhaonella thermotolerans]|uniref:Secreted protein n=1 Tax=Bailinhaonella thermotolerans TaxID=1070861 RepID=A0A3A4B0U0_9ACTN|nr:hypothetical protein [Bailinhaonella thermotolerans]RJL33558.1 hypothetical protein D5H75_12415 [Bailinhaonella thermotolerans]
MRRLLIVAAGAALLGAVTVPGAASLAASGSAPAAPQAAATQPPGGGGSQNGKDVTVWVHDSQVRFSGSGYKGGRGDGYRPPACWHEPGPDAREYLDQRKRFQKDWLDGATPEERAEWEKRVEEWSGKLDEKGRWWMPAFNAADRASDACRESLTAVWVPDGQAPPPTGITMETLARLARGAMTVPDPQIGLSPGGKSFVNLPTHVWLENMPASERRKSVTASIPGMSATVVANLTKFKIDPGAPATRVRHTPECEAPGQPYTRGAEFTCGAQYLQASIDQPDKVYVLTVTTEWEVSGYGEGAPPGGGDGPDRFFDFSQLENVVVTASIDVPVHEVQSTVERRP